VSRPALIAAARATLAQGLNHGTTGNLSVRTDSGMLITPSAVPFDALAEADLVALPREGGVPDGARPSSEWRLHAGIYRRRPDAEAVVHAHPPFCTTLACLREELPAVHYMVTVAGGDRVRCSRYASFGSAELAEAALEAMETRKACLLANHGLVAIGRDLSEALFVAREIEAVAEYYCRARTIGRPVVLSAAEIADALARMATYR
jgi:L-fuculose-phosphate aldolase